MIRKALEDGRVEHREASFEPEHPSRLRATEGHRVARRSIQSTTPMIDVASTSPDLASGWRNPVDQCCAVVALQIARSTCYCSWYSRDCRQNTKSRSAGCHSGRYEEMTSPCPDCCDHYHLVPGRCEVAVPGSEADCSQKSGLSPSTVCSAVR